jgi:hypothetical protein
MLIEADSINGIDDRTPTPRDDPELVKNMAEQGYMEGNSCLRIGNFTKNEIAKELNESSPRLRNIGGAIVSSQNHEKERAKKVTRFDLSGSSVLNNVDQMENAAANKSEGSDIKAMKDCAPFKVDGHNQNQIIDFDEPFHSGEEHVDLDAEERLNLKVGNQVTQTCAQPKQGPLEEVFQ